jgi:hypothetical protein
MAARGYDDSQLAHTERSTGRSEPDLERSTLLGRERARKIFNKMVADIGGCITIQGTKVHDWTGATSHATPEWNESIIRPYMTVYIATRKRRKNGKFCQSTLDLFVHSILGAYEQDKGAPMGEAARTILFRSAKDLGARFHLARGTQPKAALSPQSVVDLLCATAVLQYPVRYRLALMAYQSIATVTGLRASSLISTWGQTRHAQLRTGLLWRDLYAWVVPSDDENTSSNQVIIYLKPRWAKTFWGSATTFPLLSGPHLAGSANLLVLRMGELDGAFEFSTERVLERNFCSTPQGFKPRRLRIFSSQ